jgi:hypothetical protein
MDDDTITGADPPEETVTEGQATPDPPRPTIEAYLAFKDRIASDTDGSIGEMMKSFAAAQPEALRERLENDVDYFSEIWDKFANAFPPRPASAPPPPPPSPGREYEAPEWRKAQIEREARRTRPVFDATFSIGGGGIQPEPGVGERAAAQRQQREIDGIRQRVRGGDREAEFELASRLFGDSRNWKPTHGPDHF